MSDDVSESVFNQLAECEVEVDKIEKGIELQRLRKLQDVYKRRDELIRKVPGFWKVVLSQHTDFANYIRASDFKYVDCIEKLSVEWLNQDFCEFEIVIEFKSIPNDFPSQVVRKWFRKEKGGDEDERLVSRSVDGIQWPGSYNSINPDLIKDKKSDVGKKNYRQGMKSLFGWFRWTGLKKGKEFPHGDMFAELILNDIYPYCMKYYIEAQRDLEDEESSGNDDDSDGSSQGRLDLE